MWWWIGGMVFIGALAWILRKASKNTRFAGNCACTPNIEHLKGIEDPGAQKYKKENLW